MIQVDAKVLLKTCPHGQPSTVIRIERNRAVVLWADLNFIARHHPASLMETENAAAYPEKSLQFSPCAELSL